MERVRFNSNIREPNEPQASTGVSRENPPGVGLLFLQAAIPTLKTPTRSSEWVEYEAKTKLCSRGGVFICASLVGKAEKKPHPPGGYPKKPL